MNEGTVEALQSYLGNPESVYGGQENSATVGVCGALFHQSSIREMRAIHDAILKGWISAWYGHLPQ